jgi:hypothetical protein
MLPFLLPCPLPCPLPANMHTQPQRVHIQATYWYNVKQPPVLGALATGGANATYCQQLGDELEKLRSVWDWITQELHRVRQKCLPGTRR